MNLTASTPLRTFALATLLSVNLASHAQTSPKDFSGEPDKSMAAAHDSFIKGDMKQAGNDIDKASTYVKKESGHVAVAARADLTKAGAELDKLGKSVKAGTVKSDDQMKKTFAKVDHSLASAYHQTAAESQKAGKDAGADLKKAGAALEGAQASVDGIKKGVQASGEQVGKWFNGIGDGIKDLGQKL